MILFQLLSKLFFATSGNSRLSLYRMAIALLIGILVFTFAAFTFDWLPIDVVALTCLALLLLFNLVTPEEAISGFSNPAVITVMMMFVLSHALTSTGIIRRLGRRIARLSGGSYWIGGATLLTISGVLSAFINNTAALAIFMPVAIQLAKHYDVSPSKILLPLSYISIIGGTCTLIGTSTNLLVASLAEEHGLEPIGVFEFFSLGAILFVVGAAYTLLVPMRFLPPRSDSSSLTRKYRLTAFLTEVIVPENSRLIGRTVLDARISEAFQLNVLEIVRGSSRIALDLRNTAIAAGDQLIVRGEMENIINFKEQFDLLLLTDTKLQDSDISDENNILAEIQLSPAARLTGRSVREIDFRRRYGCFVLALNRTGEMMREKLASIELKQWDTLLVFGPRSRVEALYELDDFVPLQELDIRLRLARNWWLPILIIPAVILLATFGLMTILEASILGVVALLLTRGINIQQAYEAINWSVIFLLAAILPLGIAMERTGLAGMIGQGIADVGTRFGPLGVLALIYLSTALLSEIVSNNSTAVLMVPIAITTAASLGLDARPFVMAVAFGASASFLTPMGYQTNAMVYGPGSYKFSDYLIFGAPLKITFWIISTLMIPVLWPLQP